MTISQTSVGFDEKTEAQLRADCEQILSRYPVKRSALGPMLHLIQSVDGYVSPRGITLCAEILGLSRAEVSAVATFYSQYKRHRNGEYTVGVCTNALCAVMGGDIIYETLCEDLGIHHGETTADGKVTLEALECNAACDFAPVIMVNWEFFDNQTPASALELVNDLRAGKPVHPTRGPDVAPTFREVSRLLAGFEDGLVDQGPAGGEASMRGLRIAREQGWTAPQPTQVSGADSDSPDGAASSAEKKEGEA